MKGVLTSYIENNKIIYTLLGLVMTISISKWGYDIVQIMALCLFNIKP